jgi:hypothetical protein
MASIIQFESAEPTSNILGMSLTNIVVGQNVSKTTLTGGGSIADRIAELSVPTGLVYIPEDSTHYKLQYRSNKPYYMYDTISDDLYDKLLDLVSENGASNKSTSKSRNPKIKKGGNKTRRNS